MDEETEIVYEMGLIPYEIQQDAYRANKFVCDKRIDSSLHLQVASGTDLSPDAENNIVRGALSGTGG